MKKILLEIDRQIKEAEARLAENKNVLSDEMKKEYLIAIADLKSIREKMEYKLDKLDRLYQLMTKVTSGTTKMDMSERKNQ